MQVTKLKICLAGEAAVGKTSLIRKFVKNEFDDHYLSTFGAKVTKKDMQVEGPHGTVPVVVNLWDIMGIKTLRELLWEAYFHGVQGILAMCDLTRGETLSNLYSWISAIRNDNGSVPVILLGNKVDLMESKNTWEGPLVSFSHNFGCSYVPTSAKTGVNVERAFAEICQRVLQQPEYQRAL